MIDRFGVDATKAVPHFYMYLILTSAHCDLWLSSPLEQECDKSSRKQPRRIVRYVSVEVHSYWDCSALTAIDGCAIGRPARYSLHVPASTAFVARIGACSGRESWTAVALKCYPVPMKRVC
jgi:hypothetical protein